jgi:hypothetical protein
VIDIDLDPTGGDDGCVRLALSTDQFHVVVHIPPEQLPRFAEVGGRRWTDGAIPIGRCAGGGAFWSTNDGALSLLIGHDDQTWDVSLSMPADTLTQIMATLQCFNLSNSNS